MPGSSSWMLYAPQGIKRLDVDYLVEMLMKGRSKSPFH
jgi:hypothetical protein